jgi:hypothetical protein
MTPEQYNRWARFAIRMAHRGWPRLPRKSRKKIAGMVKEFFGQLGLLAEYDATLISRIRSWDNTDRCAECAANLEEARRTQNWYKVNTCPCDRTLICDLMMELTDQWNPNYYSDNERGVEGGYRYRQWNDTWGNRVSCCIRAGLDLASEASAGVLGFEVCDLRRMYRNNIPAWINNGEWEDHSGERVTVDLNSGECAVSIWL